MGSNFLSQALQSAAVDPSPTSLALVVLLIAVLPLSMVVPMTGICLAAAAVLPQGWAVPLILTGILLNTGIAWGLARTVFGARLEGWLEKRGGALAAIREGARRQSLKWSILSRFMPAPFLAAPMVLASTGVGLGTTLLGSGIAMLPWCFAYVWLVKAGRQGSLGSLGAAVAALVALGLVANWLRKRFAAPKPLPLLVPRRADLPLVTLYTLPGHALSDEAREDLAALRDGLGFEVQELPLGPGADPALLKAHENHAPVAVFEGVKLFNFKMDENVLRVRLNERQQPKGMQA